MNKALILHTISDADHCIKNNLFKDSILFSTNAAISVYLREYYNIDCYCLSSYLTTEEVIACRDRVSEIVENVLLILDSKISLKINKNNGLNLKYFYTLYSYLGKYHLLGYLTFQDSLKKIIQKYDINHLIFYDKIFNECFDIETGMMDLCSILLIDIKVDIIKAEIPNDLKNQYILRRIRKLIAKIKNPYQINYSGKLKGLLEKYYIFNKKYDSNKKTLLISEPLYNLSFIIKKLNNYNFIYYSNYYSSYPKKIKNINFEKRNVINHDLFDDCCIESSPLHKIFYEEVKSDFLKKIHIYLNGIFFLEEIMKSGRISLGIWGCPPVEKFRSLIFEYLRSKGVKIVGAQHGSQYVDVYSPWHFDSDFNRCDYYISYGFNEKDFSNTYPENPKNIKIFPLGYINKLKPKKNKIEIDILFPITNNLSIFNGGMNRTSPHKLTQIQIQLLEYLDSLKQCKVYVKPFPGINYENCSFLPLLKRLKNIKIVQYMYLNRFLEHYHPKIVIIEFPSQPLYEVLGLDSDIFMLGDDINPYTKEALKELKDRVYYSENVKDLISDIENFRENKLPKKRDNTFYNHYVKKSSEQENILNLIEDILEDKR